MSHRESKRVDLNLPGRHTIPVFFAHEVRNLTAQPLARHGD